MATAKPTTLCGESPPLGCAATRPPSPTPKKRQAEGKTRPEIIRCLKRHIARQVYQLLTDPPPTPNGTHLRCLRQNTRTTLSQAATALQTHPNRISQLERGLYHNHQLATRYHQWLTTQNRFDKNRSIRLAITTANRQSPIPRPGPHPPHKPPLPPPNLHPLPVKIPTRQHQPGKPPDQNQPVFMNTSALRRSGGRDRIGFGGAIGWGGLVGWFGVDKVQFEFDGFGGFTATGVSVEEALGVVADVFGGGVGFEESVGYVGGVGPRRLFSGLSKSKWRGWPLGVRGIGVES